MSFKIAVASSDGKLVDQAFGEAEKFTIYEVSDGSYRKLEERKFREKETDGGGKSQPEETCPSEAPLFPAARCEGPGSGGGCGCSGTEETSEKVELVSDCRCVVCRKIGFYMKKQLEKKAISAFDVSCTVEEALTKIVLYYRPMDKWR